MNTTLSSPSIRAGGAAPWPAPADRRGDRQPQHRTPIPGMALMVATLTLAGCSYIANLGDDTPTFRTDELLPLGGPEHGLHAEQPPRVMTLASTPASAG